MFMKNDIDAATLERSIYCKGLQQTLLNITVAVYKETSHGGTS